MNIKNLPALEDGLANVIIETPANSRHKYDYDSEFELFGLNKTLPLGMTFPYDFGFIPNTRGEDGDPLDVMVLMDEPAYPGCLVKSRIIGLLEAEQTERDGSKVRNDRWIAVDSSSLIYAELKDIDDVSKTMKRHLQDFFINYNNIAGKKFEVLRWGDAKTALNEIGRQSSH